MALKDFVGLDIGAGSIKLVGLEKSKEGTWFLKVMGETENKVGLPDEKGSNVSELASLIKALVTDLKLKTRTVVVSLPEKDVVSRLVKLPPLKESEIQDALTFEAETFVPYPVSEALIDYSIVSRDEAGRMLIFAVAARKTLVVAYEKVFKKAGLELVAIESPAVAMNRVISSSVSSTGSVLLMDLGETTSDIVIARAGDIYLTRPVSVGGEALTRAISINLGLDMKSAEEYKKAYGMRASELEGKIKNALLPVFGSMAEEIRKAIIAYREEWGKTIDLLVLSGGGANMPGLAEELTRVLGLEVQVIQPFLKVDSSGVIAPIDLTMEGCRFTLATGLAMREV